MGGNVVTRDSGLYIVTNCDKSQLSRIIDKNIGNEILYPRLHNGKLSLVYKYVRFYDSEQVNNTGIRDLYNEKDFEKILRYKVDSKKDESLVRSLYDILAVRILYECPEIDRDNAWATTKAGEVAIRFFSLFNPERMLDGNKLSDERLESKMKMIMDYTVNVVFRGYNAYDEVIFNRIKNTYLNKCRETKEYALLHENRYITLGGKRISDKILENIRDNKLYGYICAIASHDDENSLSNKTNEFLRNILSSETHKFDITPLLSDINDRENIMASIDHLKREELDNVLQEIIRVS